MGINRRRLSAWAVAVAAAVAFAGPLAGFYFESRAVWSGPVTMQLQLGPSGQLSDGSADWDQSAVDALQLWNEHLKSPVQFKYVLHSTAAIKKSDRVNNVFFGDDVFGDPFPAGTAAMTLLRWNGTKMVDADVIFNRAFAFDSYRGPNRGDVVDFRRAALHEFGHVLGLNHPDVAGQEVVAIMNSQVSDTEEPQPDDVEGVESIYGRVETRATGSRLWSGGTVERTGFVAFPSREDALAFRSELEAKFRDGLQRPAALSFVDPASATYWTQEYVRYRVQACGHQDALQRTFMQMDGLGVQPVCGTTSDAVMPQRDELFDFRNQLEARYRNEFKANTSSTFVDQPLDAAWVQEYLRYRLGHCGHAEAAERVFAELDGRGVAATCR